MNFITSYDLSLFSIIILVYVFASMVRKKEIRTTKSVLFSWIVLSTLLNIFLEVASRSFNGLSGDFNYYMHWISTFSLKAFNNILVCLWASYIDYSLFKDIGRLKKRWFYSHALIAILILSIINLFYPILFTISSDNVYSNARFSFLPIVFILIVYFIIVRLIYIKRESVNSQFFGGIMIFLLIAISTKILQLTLFSELLLWPFTGLAIYFAYIIFETTSSNRDFLTGAFTRMRAEYAIESNIFRKKAFSAILMDLDDFKMINDTYGHSIGDEVLKEFAFILRNVFPKSAIVSRYGGDEFIVVIEEVKDEIIELYKNNIELHLRSNELEYLQNLRISMGVEKCIDNFETDYETVMVSADNKMYVDKAHNKNLKRRKEDKLESEKQL